MKQMIALLGLALLLSGCHSVYNAESISAKDLSREGTAVVVRPDRYVLWGTRSMNDYLEVVYEDFGENQAGLAVVEMGIRNKGGEHWYDLKGPDFTLYAQAVFYREPVEGTAARSAPLYRTNKQPVPMPRGETSDIKFVCPVPGAGGYQVILSEK